MDDGGPALRRTRSRVAGTNLAFHFPRAETTTIVCRRGPSGHYPVQEVKDYGTGSTDLMTKIAKRVLIAVLLLVAIFFALRDARAIDVPMGEHDPTTQDAFDTRAT